MSVTFEVDPVGVGSTRLATTSLADAVACFSGPIPLEAAGTSAGAQGLHPCNAHPLIEALQWAYARHLPLELGPDQIWQVLAQGFATHVNLHAEELRERFVRHTGKLELVVQRDDFVRGAGLNQNPWPEVFDAFSDQLREQLGKRHDLVVADFSTTGSLERAVSILTLMDATSSYFDYTLVSRCGIPRITLQGEPADWRSIRTRAQVFREFGLGWWLDALAPSLDGFVDAAEGRVDRGHWSRIFKSKGMSGGPYLSGWIVTLFPYLRPWGEVEKNTYLDTWGEPGPTSCDFPSALSRVDLSWNYLGELIPTELLGGFIGVAQDDSSGALAPALGWAVRTSPQAWAADPPDGGPPIDLERLAEARVAGYRERGEYVLALLDEAEAAVSNDYLCLRMGISRGEMALELKRLERSGQISRVREGASERFTRTQ